jgi:hypothetical protein
MKVVVSQPWRAPEIRHIEGPTLKALQSLVGGTIEAVADAPEALDLWANDDAKYAQFPDAEGKLRYLEPNIRLWDGQDYLFGTAVVAGSTPDGDTRGLTEAEIDIAFAWLEDRRVGLFEGARATAWVDANFR